MIVELLRNLKVDGGRIMVKGRYTDKHSPFPQKLYEEIRIGRAKTVKLIRYEPHDKQSQSSKEEKPSQANAKPTTTLDEGEADTLTVEEEPVTKSSTTKKGTRKPRTTSARKKS